MIAPRVVRFGLTEHAVREGELCRDASQRGRPRGGEHNRIIIGHVRAAEAGHVGRRAASHS